MLKRLLENGSLAGPLQATTAATNTSAELRGDFGQDVVAAK